MLLIQSEIRDYWKISLYTISRLIEAGKLEPRIREKNKLYFNYSDLVEKLGPPLQVYELIAELKEIEKKNKEEN